MNSSMSSDSKASENVSEYYLKKKTLYVLFVEWSQYEINPQSTNTPSLSSSSDRGQLVH